MDLFDYMIYCSTADLVVLDDWFVGMDWAKNWLLISFILNLNLGFFYLKKIFLN